VTLVVSVFALIFIKPLCYRPSYYIGLSILGIVPLLCGPRLYRWFGSAYFVAALLFAAYELGAEVRRPKVIPPVRVEPYTLTPENTDIMATVNKMVDDFNKGDTKSVLAACTDEMSIIDEFPPHEWHGAGAFSKWFADYDAYSKKNGITDGVFSIGIPWHVDVTGNLAYVVVPAQYTYKRNGKPVRETGPSPITLKKTEAGWRITGWAWAKH